eukprot:scaffold175782_cov19-Tisochrysis_lutea.AAC.1
MRAVTVQGKKRYLFLVIWFHTAVPDEERQAIVASYLDSLVAAQQHAQEAAQKRLKDLYT